MDRNTLTGFALLAVLVIGYFAWNSHSRNEYEKANKHYRDSIAATQPRKPDSTHQLANPQTGVAAGQAPQLTDSQRALLPPALNGAAQMIKLENKNLAITVSTQGAHPVIALLKDYKTYDGKPLRMFDGPANKLAITLPGGFVQGGSATATPTTDLFFTAQQQSPLAATFTSELGGGRRAVIAYRLPAEGYMMDVSVAVIGLTGAQNLPMTWQTLALNTERDVSTERINSQVYYHYKGGDHDYYTIKPDNETKDLTDTNPMRWVGLRQHYFSTALVAGEGTSFTATKVASTVQLPDSAISSQASVNTSLALKADGTAQMQWYIGPNHYQTLRTYKDLDLDEMVPLGFGLFAFVKYINKWLIIPVFDFLHHGLGIMNMGIIIMILTIFIRLLLSFFTYKSYLSTAKMRALKPELDELRARLGDNQQAMGMEQMKLYRQAGVNPLGGCLPTLFQIPILFAMYYFFPSAIELRQQGFLWAHDLSTYDSIASIPNIPFYGDHISLFTLLMTASSLFLAIYNRNMTAGQDMNNPMLKYMPFVFPFLLLGVFNKMAAALTFYYFFSNMLSILQQFVIQKFIINEKKIHAQILANRNKPATPSKWAAKIEEMQRMQQERAKK